MQALNWMNKLPVNHTWQNAIGSVIRHHKIVIHFSAFISWPAYIWTTALSSETLLLCFPAQAEDQQLIQKACSLKTISKSASWRKPNLWPNDSSSVTCWSAWIWSEWFCSRLASAWNNTINTATHWCFEALTAQLPLPSGSTMSAKWAVLWCQSNFSLSNCQSGSWSGSSAIIGQGTPVDRGPLGVPTDQLLRDQFPKPEPPSPALDYVCFLSSTGRSKGMSAVWCVA